MGREDIIAVPLFNPKMQYTTFSFYSPMASNTDMNHYPLPQRPCTPSARGAAKIPRGAWPADHHCSLASLFS
jgi:hypothetical protein